MNLKESTILLRRIKNLSLRDYPQNCEYVANCHESFSEAEEIIPIFTGKTRGQVDFRELRHSESVPFLKKPILAYFLPEILESIVRQPSSNFADWMIGFSFRRKDRPTDLHALLTEEERALVHDVCLYALRTRRPKGFWDNMSREDFGLIPRDPRRLTDSQLSEWRKNLRQGF